MRSLAIDVLLAAAATAIAVRELYIRSHTIVYPYGQGVTFPAVTVSGRGVHRITEYAAVRDGQVIKLLSQPPQLPFHGHMPAMVLVGVILSTAPLAFRRTYPLAACCVIFAAILTSSQNMPVAFGAALFAAYCAIVYSRYRQLALGVVVVGGALITASFPNSLPQASERYTAILVAVPAVAVALGTREWRTQAADSSERLRHARAEHQAATRRAIELEQARIASELHDVVTHNVSVMVVQAGAAQQVLEDTSVDVQEALSAIETSGRTALGELRHLLGLLNPAADGATLGPQPGLGELGPLIERVSAAGLTVEMHTTGTPASLPPGIDLAAYRVVQEALTNVLKHAGPASVAVRLQYRPAELAIKVSDAGGGASSTTPAAGTGRGLIGMRERVALYGGQLNAGPRLGGGWRVDARIPLPAAGEDEPGMMLSGSHAE